MPDGSVVLVEIRGKRLTRVYPDGRKEVVAEIPGGPNGAALGPTARCTSATMAASAGFPTGKMIMPGPQPDDYQGGSIQRVDLQSGKVETVVTRCGEHPLRGPNDLVFDKHGGLWFSELRQAPRREMDVGGMYYLKPGYEGDRRGRAWRAARQRHRLSPRREHRLQSRKRRPRGCWAYDLSAPGTLEAARRASIAASAASRSRALAATQMFDSLAVEANGNVCVATLISGCISVIAPDGTLVEQVPTGDRVTTNHRVRWAGAEDGLHHAVGQGRTDRDGLGAVCWTRALNFLNK
jgi:gluconolactonase